MIIQSRWTEEGDQSCSQKFALTIFYVEKGETGNLTWDEAFLLDRNTALTDNWQIQAVDQQGAALNMIGAGESSSKHGRSCWPCIFSKVAQVAWFPLAEAKLVQQSLRRAD